MSNIGALSAIAFIISLLTVKVLTIKFKQQLVDLPNERSSHTQPTPRGGGLGFIISFFAVISAIILVELTDVNFAPWLSLLPLVIIGFLDDWKNLPASVRYFVQLSVSSLLVIQLGAFTFFAEQGSSHSIAGIGAIAVTIIGITALINFYNFMDGLDGLVASTAAIQFFFLASWSQDPSLWILSAAIMGFLVWNWSPAKIFMGDSGSTFLGAAVAIALLSRNSSPSDAWATLTITLPITLDTIYTLTRRLLKGENIFQAHRSHLFQQLHQSGWSHAKVSSLYAVATLISGITLLLLGPIGGIINAIGAVITLVVIEVYLKNTSSTSLFPHLSSKE